MTEAANTPSGGSAPDNVPTFTVSEIGQAVKRSIEGAYARVRVRGEISRPSFPGSGHCYFRLKDTGAVLDAVIWRGVRGRIKLTPEDGMEVIATGKLTAYPGKSSYQLMVEGLELAGEGALLKLLEERRKKLAAEGLFDAARKRPLPYLPEVVGVITSPTGAVIRDILHRLAERFPRRVVVWPVAVQGDSAAGQVAAAIAGFNALSPDGPVPRPEVLIVARGGGSLEDLWAFNEEVVVRAAAASALPLIAAVGHETDTTLIDYAADRRAPTPSAAAEITVPVRGELVAQVADLSGRLTAAGARSVETRRGELAGLARGLPDPARRVQELWQRLDDRGARLALALRRRRDRAREQVAALGTRLPHPRQQIARARERLDSAARALAQAGARSLERRGEALIRLDAERRLPQGLATRRDQARRDLESLGRILDGYSYKKTLARGYAVVRDGGDGRVLTRKAQVGEAQPLEIEFADGRQPATAGTAAAPRPKPRRKPASEPPGGEGNQGSLL